LKSENAGQEPLVGPGSNEYFISNSIIDFLPVGCITGAASVLPLVRQKRGHPRIRGVCEELLYNPVFPRIVCRRMSEQIFIVLDSEKRREQTICAQINRERPGSPVMAFGYGISRLLEQQTLFSSLPGLVKTGCSNLNSSKTQNYFGAGASGNDYSS